MGKLIRRLTIGALVLSAACTTSQQTEPPLAGPSEFALSLRVTATPDSISQDGASQSSIVVNAFDPNGRGISGLALRMDMAVNGMLQDYGTLSARTIVTGTDGRAATVYTAPVPPPPAAGGAATVVTVVATPTGSNFATVNPQIASDPARAAWHHPPDGEHADRQIHVLVAGQRRFVGDVRRLQQLPARRRSEWRLPRAVQFRRDDYELCLVIRRRRQRNRTDRLAQVHVDWRVQRHVDGDQRSGRAGLVRAGGVDDAGGSTVRRLHDLAEQSRRR